LYLIKDLISVRERGAKTCKRNGNRVVSISGRNVRILSGLRDLEENAVVLNVIIRFNFYGRKGNYFLFYLVCIGKKSIFAAYNSVLAHKFKDEKEKNA